MYNVFCERASLFTAAPDGLGVCCPVGGIRAEILNAIFLQWEVPDIETTIVFFRLWGLCSVHLFVQ